MPVGADAATLFLSPGSTTLRENETISVTVRVNTQAQSINASEGVLKFNPAHLSVESLTSDGSIFNLNVQEPEYSNVTGTINFAGVILNPGYSGASGTLLTIRFRARAPGATAVTFASGAVLANDGSGTDVLSARSGSNIVIVGAEATPVPTASPELPVQAGQLVPIITSPTHPNPDRWYPSSNARFTWVLPAGASGVSWLIHPKPDGNPGNVLDGLIDEVTFDDIEEGLTYFHIKFQHGGVFGPVAHYGFRTDTEPPLPFTVERLETGDLTDPEPFLTFETEDVTSGIEAYRMHIGDGVWFDVPESPIDRPFRMPLLRPGVYPITVEAIDGAGLTSRATTVITVESITVPVITSYPGQVSADEAFLVAGTAAAGHEVTVRAWPVGPIAGFLLSDKPVATVDAFADDEGRWSLSIDGLGIGTYELQATAGDSRGAVSDPGAGVTVRVGSWLVRQLSSAPYWLRSLPLWGQLLAGIAAASLLWLLGRSVWWLLGGRRRRKVRIVKIHGKAASVLEMVIDDIETELATIEHLSKGRPLYPEEQHLKKKLKEYHKMLGRLARGAGTRRTSRRRKR